MDYCQQKSSAALAIGKIILFKVLVILFKKRSSFHVRCTWQEKAMSAHGKDQFHWRCTGRSHRSRISMRTDSFFADSKLTIRDILRIIYYWSRQVKLQEIEHETGISRNALIDWIKLIREVCGTWLLDHPIAIGGEGRTIAVDESKFFHRKYHRGRYTDGHWVLGGIDVDDHTQCFLQTVPRRDSATLIPVVQKYVLPRTRIWTDEWAAYRQLGLLGYHHYTVNHTENFVCQHSGVHTNAIEGLWSRVKAKFRAMHGTSDVLFDSYLEEYLWLVRFPANRFAHILEHIAEQN